MPRSKEISEDVRRKVVEAHESGKGYKLISKEIGLPKTTIRAILRKWKRFGTVVTLPRSGRPSKISPRARREIIREVMKNPCTTSKDLQATLASSNICVHQSTIRRILGIHGRPTLSSFEGSMVLQTSGQDDEGILGGSGGVNDDEELAKNSNTNNTNVCSTENTNNKESPGHNVKMSTNENKCDEMPSTHLETKPNTDGQCESETFNDDTETNPKKHHVEAAITSSVNHDAVYAAGCDIDGAYSNNTTTTNNNNNGGPWSEDMDYISTLTFS